VLQADREEKIQAIEKERARIALLSELDPSTIEGGERRKQIRLDSMRKHVEHLKILADINDPLIKKRFEDGEGVWHSSEGPIAN
jgi:large subunit ribosomal protein L35